MIAIIGSGRLGSTLATQIAATNLDDVTLLDVVEGLPEGEALDLEHMAAQFGTDVDFKGSNDFRELTGADLVVVTAGLARKPGMTRMDLLAKNFSVITEVSRKISQYAPEALVMMVTNPLDVMTHVALKVTGLPTKKVFGMGGMLDCSRFKSVLAKTLGVSNSTVQAMVIGEHGEGMTALPRFSSVSGIPVLELMSEKEADEVADNTVKVAAKVISLKGATVFAPAQAMYKMVEAVIRDRKALLPLSTYLNGEYGVKDICIGVPAILGRNGVEKIIELKLNEKEKPKFMLGVKNIQDAIKSLPDLSANKA